MPTDTFIIGAGGHGKVVLDALMAQNIIPLLLDENEAIIGKELLGCPIELLSKKISVLPPHGHVAIGNNSAREKLANQLLVANHALLTVIHPHAVTAPSSSLGAGCFVAANAVIGPDATIGDGCIINHGAIVDHDGLLDVFCHIAPNSTLGGNVTLGKNVLVGSGAAILPNITVGSNVTIGAGAVVTQNIKSNCIVAGVPARVMNES